MGVPPQPQNRSRLPPDRPDQGGGCQNTAEGGQELRGQNDHRAVTLLFGPNSRGVAVHLSSPRFPPSRGSPGKSGNARERRGSRGQSASQHEARGSTRTGQGRSGSRSKVVSYALQLKTYLTGFLSWSYVLGGLPP